TSAKPSPLKSRCPTIAQGFAAEPGEPPPMMLVPFINETIACPVVWFHQRMSLRASWLKSWVAVKAAATKPAAQHPSMLSSRRNPFLEFGLFVFPPAYRIGPMAGMLGEPQRPLRPVRCHVGKGHTLRASSRLMPDLFWNT